MRIILQNKFISYYKVCIIGFRAFQMGIGIGGLGSEFQPWFWGGKKIIGNYFKNRKLFDTFRYNFMYYLLFPVSCGWNNFKNINELFTCRIVHMQQYCCSFYLSSLLFGTVVVHFTFRQCEIILRFISIVNLQYTTSKNNNGYIVSGHNFSYILQHVYLWHS